MSSPQNPGQHGTPPSGDNPWNQPTVAGPPGQAVPGPGGGGWDQNPQGGPDYAPGSPAYGAQPPFSEAQPPFSGGAPPFSGADPSAPGASGYGAGPYGTQPPPPPPGYGAGPGYGGPGYGGAMPPPGQKSNTALWIVGGVIGVVMLLCLAGLLLFQRSVSLPKSTESSPATVVTSPTTKAGIPTTAASGGGAVTPGASGLVKTGANPQEISGNGPGDHTVKLNKGLILLESATPNGHLISVQDPATNSPIWSVYMANGLPFSDAKYISTAGEYKLSVSGAAAKPFKVTFSELPTDGGSAPPFSSKGERGKYLLGPVQLKGAIKMTASQRGRGNFIVHSLNSAKADENLIYNEIGDVQAMVKSAKPTGLWYFRVQADGAWEFSIEPE